jgi:DNA invertase Pin-like site-specific DNA recombinase
MRTVLPAAQYLRMSTEHQRYSIENQSAAIRTFAEHNGYTVVRTYSDPGKSGLTMKRRNGLAGLLNDVVGGDSEYKVILVYDVSRWGRFQDNDEAAYYEFICKSAGVPVVYCNEVFTNDCTLVNMIAKSLKRSMAAEYSRELSVKVLESQKRMCARGFKPGGRAGFGLRRYQVSDDASRCHVLEQHQYKGLHSDRVILVPGPKAEVDCVKKIYKEFIENRTKLPDIARMLNREGAIRQSGKNWSPESVREILKHPKYCGTYVYGRTTARLGSRQRALPKGTWHVYPKIIPPIVSTADFERAQAIFSNRTIKKSNEQLLKEIKELLQRTGHLSLHQIEDAGIASLGTLKLRLGGCKQIYDALGYDYTNKFKSMETRRSSLAVRQSLIGRIAAEFPTEVAILPARGNLRARIQVRGVLVVGVSVITPSQDTSRHTRWLLHLTKVT